MDKLDAMQRYAYTKRCRRAFVLRYFGDPAARPECGACDNCLGPPNGRSTRRQSTGRRPPTVPPAAGGTEPQADPVESVYRELVSAHTASNLPGPPPDRRQIADFLDRQREKLHATFGDRELDFHVVTENGRPRIKVRDKK